MSESSSFNQIVLSYPGATGHQEVRTIKRGEEVLFCLADVVKVLAAENGRLSEDAAGKGFRGIYQAQVNALDPDEQETIEEPSQRGYDISRQTYVTQPGLFRVVLGDTSPAAKKFQRWVLHEVLPSIQKHGTYPPPPERSDSSDIRRATELLLEEIKAREELERQTKLKFAEHESRIEALADQVSQNQTPDRLTGCVSIADYCKNHDLDESSQLYIFGMAQKLCLEQKRPHGKRPGLRGALTETHVFPEEIIEDALQLHLKR